jgi:hypothetical protein
VFEKDEKEGRERRARKKGEKEQWTSGPRAQHSKCPKPSTPTTQHVLAVAHLLHLEPVQTQRLLCRDALHRVQREHALHQRKLLRVRRLEPATEMTIERAEWWDSQRELVRMGGPEIEAFNEPHNSKGSGHRGTRSSQCTQWR